MSLQQRKRQFFTSERINALLIIAGVYALLPFLYIARYDHPSADDYGFALLFSEHGLGEVWKQQYFEWTGRYLLPVFYRADPTVAHSLAGYRLCAAGVILLFAAAVAMTVRSFTRAYLNRREALGLSALLVALYFAKTPGISEAFYWFPAYAIYQLPNICFLLLLVGLVKMRRQEKTALIRPATAGRALGGTAPAWRAPIRLAGSAILCALIMGCNEVSLITTCAFMGYYTVTRYVKERKVPGALVVLCVVCAIFAVIEIAAPGNLIRLHAQRRTFGSMLWAITGAFSTTALYGSQWIGPLLAASVLYIPLFGLPLAEKMGNGRPVAAPGGSFELPIRSFAAFLVVMLCFLPLFVFWAASGSDLGRVLDVVYFFVITGYFFLLQLLLNKHQRRLEFITGRRRIFAVAGLALFAATLLDINNNISTAWIDIASGKARAYDQVLRDRGAQVSACKTDTCNVPALPDAPATLFYTDIRPLSDATGLWINFYYSSYWRAGFVVPDAPPPVPASNLETLRNMGKGLRSRIAKK